MNDDWLRTDDDGNPYLEVPVRGADLLETPLLNKVTAFTDQERSELGLRGLLPSAVATMQQQLDRCYLAFKQKTVNLERYIYLASLQDRNETLFYRLVLENLEEMVPVIYTPVVAEACQNWSKIFRNSRGLYIGPNDKDRLDEIFDNVHLADVDIIVVTDNERILGVGDQGAGGMGIPIGKLALYTIGAGIDPSRCLPVSLDVGTNNKELLDDPLYIGRKEPRLRGDEYWDLVDRFVAAVKKRFPTALLQFEDFGNSTSFRHLDKYRTEILSFNDDIQGTAATVVAGLVGALRITGANLKDQVVVFSGSGSAGIGIARQIHAAMVEDGADPDVARSNIFTTDSKGLVMADRADPLAEHKKTFAKDRGRVDGWKVADPKAITLAEVVANAKPTVLIGVSGQGGSFDESLIKTMASNCERPIVFPLSNPTSKTEVKPADVWKWTDGKCVVATGSPFDPVVHGGKSHRIGQCNNMFVFPGVGLGALVAKAQQVTDGMFLSGARALAACVPADALEQACVFPDIDAVRDCSLKVAIAVAERAIADGVAPDSPKGDELAKAVEKAMWFPEYLPYRAAKKR